MLDETARRRFESDLHSGRVEPLEQYLPGDSDPRHLGTAEELVHIGLEFAWLSQQTATAGGETTPQYVEEYLKRLPQLNQAEIVLRLLEQEYRLRHLYGDRPSSSEYRRRFPQLVRTGREVERLLAESREIYPCIPGYEILNLLGRGGMGLVYKARHLALNRLVALKLISNATHTDQEALTRFRIEAEAVARMQHPNIVQIFDIGQQENQPFFALELVEGGNLAQHLGGQPQAAQHCAQLVETLARAVEQAHQQGIVHRDLKPANVLLSVDGDPKIADFGLAKRLEGGSAHTKTGEIIGTPSYMAPEQAAGGSAEIGRRADVYALGAILYEMLTGRPPFLADTPWNTIHQVITVEPVSPRRLQPKVPRDLETVCLKCLEKEQTRRYESAGELAEDLNRFVSDKPVVARPVGPMGRLLRWGRRNPPIAALLVSLFVVLSAGLGTAITLWMKAENNSVEARRFAARYKQEAVKAELSAEQAGVNFRKAQNVVDEFFTEVSQSQELLGGTPGTHRLRSRLLEKAEEYYEGFIAENDSVELMRESAEASWRLGRIRLELGKFSDAERAFLKSMQVYSDFVRDDPTIPDYRNSLAGSYVNLGWLYARKGATSAAIEHYKKANEIYEPLVRENPTILDYQKNLAGSYHNLASAYTRTRDFEAALEHQWKSIQFHELLVQENPAVLDYQRGLASGHHGLALVYESTGEVQIATKQYQRAIEIREQLVQETSATPEDLDGLVLSCSNLGVVYLRSEEYQTAGEHLRKAIQFCEELVRENPTSPSYQQRLASGYYNLALVYRSTGATETAIEQFQKALEVRQRLVRENPAVPNYQRSLAGNHFALGKMHQGEGATEAAEEHYEQAIQVYKLLMRDNPTVAEHQDRLAQSYDSVASIRQELGKPQAAESAYAEAVEVRSRLVAHDPENLQYKMNLAWNHHQLGLLQQSRHSYERAYSSYSAAVDLRKELVESDPEKSDYRSGLAASCWGMGFTAYRQRKWEVAIADYKNAAANYEWLAEKNPTAAENQNSLADNYHNLGIVYLATGEPQTAIQHHQKAVEIDERLVRENPRVTDYQHDLARRHGDLGAAYLSTQEANAAVQHYQNAARIWERLVSDNPKIPHYQQSLANSYNNVGFAYQNTGAIEAAVEHHRKAIETGERLLRENPTVVSYQHFLAESYNKLAWLVATCPQEAARDGALAIRSATRACGLTDWKNWSYLDTLAAAHAEAGDYVQAKEHQQKAIDLAPDAAKAELQKHLELYNNGKPYREE